ncbi:Proton myo-inositol cotransporter [Gryllus bimaculatus]|nr:Proton myo-inositol cotransporter [Gryllus bimaculatus]
MTSKYESTNSVNSNEEPTKHRNGTSFIYVLTFLSTIGGFLFGYDTGVVSGAMLLIRDEFELTTEWHEAIVSVTIGAAWLFALIGGWLTDTMGRKPVILIASIVFTAGSVVMGLASVKEVLLAGRIIVGIGIGIASMSVPVYIAESALPESRGPLVTVNTLCITCGQFIAAAVVDFYTHQEGWRYMLGLAAVPAAIQFFGFLGMPESPRWLVSKKRYDEASKVLRSIRGPDFPIEEELESMKISFLQQETESLVQKQSVWLQVLRSPSTRKALVLGCMLQGFQQLAGINTVISCSTCVDSKEGCGFCFLDTDSEVLNGTCWHMIDQKYPFEGPCNKNSTSSGPKFTWASGWCPSKYSWITVTALGIYLLFFAPGMGPMPWTINSEIYPMWARSFCNSVATSTNWIFNLLISMTFLSLTELLTKQGAFYLFAGLAGLGLLLLFFMLPETKGKTLEEMETLFSGPWCSRGSASHSKNVQYVHIRGLNRDCREDGEYSGDSDS